MNFIPCLAPDCGVEDDEEENVESKIKDQLKEVRA